MKAELINYVDSWQDVKNAAMNTIGKDTGHYPSSAWKRKILLAEHSPIRLLTYMIRLTGIPYFVSCHLVRHKIGVEHWVRTQRTDRTGVDRSSLPQDAPVEHTIEVNAQALINISRKRLCHQAAPETRQAWKVVLNTLAEHEPELRSVCVKECVYRGFCPEMKSCGYANTQMFQLEVEEYRKGRVE